MNRTELAAHLKDRAAQARADLVGIAAVARFDGVPADQDPRTIFPECRSVIVLGRRILRGALRGVEEGTSFGSTYGTFGYSWLEDNFLSQTTYDVTCHIETLGFEAVPLFGYPQEGMPTGRPVAPGKPAPNVILDVAYAAQAAGLGEPGVGGFFITPRFGTRQRFALILTDADLEADPVFTEHICGNCGACFKACPLWRHQCGPAQAGGHPRRRASDRRGGQHHLRPLSQRRHARQWPRFRGGPYRRRLRPRLHRPPGRSREMQQPFRPAVPQARTLGGRPVPAPAGRRAGHRRERRRERRRLRLRPQSRHHRPGPLTRPVPKPFHRSHNSSSLFEQKLAKNTKGVPPQKLRDLCGLLLNEFGFLVNNSG